LPANHAGIRAWLDEAGLPNVLPPLKLDVAGGSWETGPVDAVFSANTAHIMHWPVVVAMLAGVGRLLPADGLFMLYGPFNYDGRHTSESNARFDLSLRMNDPGMGIRDFEAVHTVVKHGITGIDEIVQITRLSRKVSQQYIDLIPKQDCSCKEACS
jgi:hypothetical protein